MIQLIPAIDIMDGRCVRLTRGDYDTRRVYDQDPIGVARQMEDLGFKRLHVVDLDGARAKHVVNIDVLRGITAATNLTVDFGGGIKTDDDLKQCFDAGASLVTVGSVAVTEPKLFASWLKTYGNKRIILGADVRYGIVSINGWSQDSGEELLPFLQRYTSKGVRNVLCTDITRDGMMQGPSVSLYRSIMSEHPDLHLIASGGVSSIDDIRVLNASGIPATVFGKAIYEGLIDLKQLIEEFPQC